MNELTLVTGYFNLSNIDGSISKPEGRYFDLADYLFKLDCNMVFYTENNSYMKIWLGRKKYNMLNKTLIITRQIEDLKYFDKYNEADEFVKNNQLAMQIKDKHTTSYLLFMYNKVELIDEVMAINPFNTQTFGWIDFGIDYLTKGFDLSNILENPSNKIKMCEVVHIPKHEIVSMQIHRLATNYVARTVGGFWMGNEVMMKAFTDKFREWVNIFWNNNLITYDENIYEIILQMYPDITEKYYGRYWYFFDNWNVIQKKKALENYHVNIDSV
ncbi:MAG: WlaTC/HtrL family glycosyltransferase, partial [Rickettsia endosymbiont of Ixodes persulcatus]|nr:WlaTC/HtrL family glycosyltransferase [Rickettsia endosymbiont of Ixodes persulcatus]